MNSIFKFNSRYFVMAVLLFGIEILIAKFAHDQILRPYVGDLLVVILIYCFVKSFLVTPFINTALAVLAFSYTVEVLQYFQIVNKLGLQHSKYASIIIGTSFEWIDLVAYTLGIAIVIYLETGLTKKKINANIESVLN